MNNINYKEGIITITGCNNCPFLHKPKSLYAVRCLLNLDLKIYLGYEYHVPFNFIPQTCDINKYSKLILKFKLKEQT